MVKKSITISLIALVTLALAAPLFSTENCDTPCCQQEEMNCCVQSDGADRLIGLTSCEIPVTLLLISGLKCKTTQTVDLNSS